MDEQTLLELAPIAALLVGWASGKWSWVGKVWAIVLKLVPAIGKAMKKPKPPHVASALILCIALLSGCSVPQYLKDGAADVHEGVGDFEKGLLFVESRSAPAVQPDPKKYSDEDWDKAWAGWWHAIKTELKALKFAAEKHAEGANGKGAK